MTYLNLRAVYQKGTLKLIDGLKLPEGTAVRVSVETVAAGNDEKRPSYLHPTNPQPAGSFDKLVGLVALGGDAVSDTEALYDGE